MRKLFAWLGVAMLVVVCDRPAYAGDPLKPYVVLILDTSGSMNAPTGSGPPSCGGNDTRLEHATCAINRIVNSYGDMVFALGRFRETTTGTYTNSCDANNNINGNQSGTFPNPSGGDQCNTQGVYCGDCDESIGLGDTCADNDDCFSGVCSGGRCSGAGSCTTNDREFELLSALVDGNNQLAASVTDGACTSCAMPTGGNVTTANEIWGVSPYTFTPLAAVLNGAKTYWTGANAGLSSDGTAVIWPNNAPGFAPINNDPTKFSFLPANCDPSPGCTTNCCASQCRPYITILLTDGAETCTAFNNTTAAAASLLNTDVNNRRYTIETKPIGFGISAGDPQIEAIADAGSRTPAIDDGFYASDEQSLQLAISDILDDAIKSETCNNADDDCDTLVDEDFPGKGSDCTNGAAGICRVDGDNVCRADGTGLACDAGVAACNGVSPGGACTVTNSMGTNVAGTCQGGACVPTPQTEVCNNLDDDCDGKIDENLSNCTCAPQGEVCDNADQDCDGQIDEGVVKPCGTGTCQGTQTCTSGSFGQCLDGNGQPVQTPTTEVCNGEDDNCDGIVDGLEQACSTMNPLPPEFFPIDDPRNNPGHPSNTPIAENICQPGKKTCPVGSGQFGACQGEVKPCYSANGTVDGCADLCDGVDVDCDNLVDEDFAPADCSSNCGLGTTMCVNGQIVCNSVPVGTDDTCNNVDDDCDNLIDEGWVSPGTCGQGPPATVCNGMVECQMGVEVCVGDPVGQESCNCEDDDCDNIVDEGSLCGPGAACKFCQCALPCAMDEFPCPMGKFCKQDANGDGYCIADPCFNVTCPDVNGEKQVCRPNANGDTAVCLSACDPSVVQCGTGEVCIPSTGECKPDNCHTFPDRCAADELCIAGECKKDLCSNVQCGANQYCVEGQCFGSCAGVECPDGERCRLGLCEKDPCGKPCPFGQVCVESAGECKPDPCQSIPCPEGQWCNPQTIACEDDPCNGTTCPGADQVCKGGTCFDAEDLLPDAPTEERVTTGGGGGCSTGGDLGLVLALGVLAFVSRRRRRGGRS